jgi:hypothetical protein
MVSGRRNRTRSQLGTCNNAPDSARATTASLQARRHPREDDSDAARPGGLVFRPVRVPTGPQPSPGPGVCREPMQWRQRTAVASSARDAGFGMDRAGVRGKEGGMGSGPLGEEKLRLFILGTASSAQAFDCAVEGTSAASLMRVARRACGAQPMREPSVVRLLP